jgi:hypothetical protein
MATESTLFVIAIMVFMSMIALFVISSRLYKILNNLREIEKRGRDQTRLRELQPIARDTKTK